MNTNYSDLIHRHQVSLNSAAIDKTKLWWEKYLKGVIPFRGVGIPHNRELLIEWRNNNQIDKWPVTDQFELALAFFNEPFAEDKLAGIIYIQNYLYSKIPWQIQIERYDHIFKSELIFDWNICDWFCVRVLGELIRVNGEECAKAIASWRDTEYLWQARSSVVAFVNLASETNYYPIIHESCSVLIRREDRFAQTAVGWLLRNISQHDRFFVISFIEKHLTSFSQESLNNALKYFEDDQKRDYLSTLKKHNKSRK